MTDTLGWRHRIGVVVPSTNTVMQPETEALRPPGVTNHVSRIAIADRALTSDAAVQAHEQAMRDGLDAAVAQVMTAAPGHLILGVALEGWRGGVAAVGALQARVAATAGVGVSLGGDAIARALRRLGATRIAVLTPHQPPGDAMVAAYLTEAGFDVRRIKGLCCASPVQIAHVPAAEIRAGLREVDGADAEALVIVGTNLPAQAVAAAAEPWLGKPVLAINAALYWDALRRLGVEDRIQGQGRILEEY